MIANVNCFDDDIVLCIFQRLYIFGLYGAIQMLLLLLLLLLLKYNKLAHKFRHGSTLFIAAESQASKQREQR